MASKKSATVPYAIDVPDRIRKERYFDPEFFALEAEQLWPRVWQMACRLEEIPNPRDYVSYEILDQSVIVVRSDDMSVSAFHNACRHRGVRLVDGPGTCTSGFT
ncbi:MAG: aromatic ring-hydroxylating oxygenase subunit alpha, partial [Mycobacteriales bacterium]